MVEHERRSFDLFRLTKLLTVSTVTRVSKRFADGQASSVRSLLSHDRKRSQPEVTIDAVAVGGRDKLEYIVSALSNHCIVVRATGFASSNDPDMHRVVTDAMPLIRSIRWFSQASKRVVSLDFSPCGTFLLILTHDGTVFVMPLRTLMKLDSVPGARSHELPAEVRSTRRRNYVANIPSLASRVLNHIDSASDTDADGSKNLSGSFRDRRETKSSRGGSAHGGGSGHGGVRSRAIFDDSDNPAYNDLIEIPPVPPSKAEYENSFGSSTKMKSSDALQASCGMWWRTFEGRDYAVTANLSGSVEFIDLRTDQRTFCKLGVAVSKLELIVQDSKSKHLLVHTLDEGYHLILLERAVPPSRSPAHPSKSAEKAPANPGLSQVASALSNASTSSSSASFSGFSDMTFKSGSDSSGSTHSTKDAKPTGGIMSSLGSFSSFRFSTSLSFYGLVTPKSAPSERHLSAHPLAIDGRLNKPAILKKAQSDRRVSAMVSQRHAADARSRGEKSPRKTSHGGPEDPRHPANSGSPQAPVRATPMLQKQSSSKRAFSRIFSPPGKAKQVASTKATAEPTESGSSSSNYQTLPSYAATHRNRGRFAPVFVNLFSKVQRLVCQHPPSGPYLSVYDPTTYKFHLYHPNRLEKGPSSTSSIVNAKIHALTDRLIVAFGEGSHGNRISVISRLRSKAASSRSAKSAEVENGPSADSVLQTLYLPTDSADGSSEKFEGWLRTSRLTRRASFGAARGSGKGEDTVVSPEEDDPTFVLWTSTSIYFFHRSRSTSAIFLDEVTANRRGFSELDWLGRTMTLNTPALYEEAADKVFESIQSSSGSASLDSYERAFALYRHSDVNVSKIVRRFLMNERVSDRELRARALKFIQDSLATLEATASRELLEHLSDLIFVCFTNELMNADRISDASPVAETVTLQSDPVISTQPLSSSFAPSPLTMELPSRNTDDDKTTGSTLSTKSFRRRLLPSFAQFLESNSYYDARGAVAVSLQLGYVHFALRIGEYRSQMHFALNSIAKVGEIRWRPSDVSYALLCGYEESLLPQFEQGESGQAYRKVPELDGSGGVRKAHASGLCDRRLSLFSVESEDLSEPTSNPNALQSGSRQIVAAASKPKIRKSLDSEDDDEMDPVTQDLVEYASSNRHFSTHAPSDVHTRIQVPLASSHDPSSSESHASVTKLSTAQSSDDPSVSPVLYRSFSSSQKLFLFMYRLTPLLSLGSPQQSELSVSHATELLELTRSELDLEQLAWLVVFFERLCVKLSARLKSTLRPGLLSGKSGKPSSSARGRLLSPPFVSILLQAILRIRDICRSTPEASGFGATLHGSPWDPFFSILRTTSGADDSQDAPSLSTAIDRAPPHVGDARRGNLRQRMVTLMELLGPPVTPEDCTRLQQNEYFSTILQANRPHVSFDVLSTLAVDLGDFNAAALINECAERWLDAIHCRLKCEQRHLVALPLALQSGDSSDSTTRTPIVVPIGEFPSQDSLDARERICGLLASHIPHIRSHIDQAALLLAICAFYERCGWSMEHLEQALLRTFSQYTPALSCMLFERDVAHSRFAELFSEEHADESATAKEDGRADGDATSLFRVLSGSMHNIKLSAKLYLGVTAAKLELEHGGNYSF